MPADISIIDVKCTDIDRKRDRRCSGSAVFGSAELEKIVEDEIPDLMPQKHGKERQK